MEPLHYGSRPMREPVAKLYDALPPVFRLARDEYQTRFDLGIPIIIAGQVVGTDGRMMVWKQAGPVIADAVNELRKGDERGFPATTTAMMMRADFGPGLPTPDVAECPACPDCGGKRVVGWISCGCCGEKTYVHGASFVCGTCDGSGKDPDWGVRLGDVVLGTRYLVPLLSWGATFRQSTTDPQKEPVHFALPCGAVGLVMPLDVKKDRSKIVGEPAAVVSTEGDTNAD